MRCSELLTEHDIQLIKQQPLFSKLVDDLFLDLTSTARVQLMDKGQMVFEAGEFANAFFIITSGVVRLYRLEIDGEEATVNIFRAGQSFGEAAIFLGSAFPVTAQCVDKVRLIRVDSARIVERIKSEPELALSMLSSMSVHLKLLVDEITLLRTPTVVRRVAEFLVRTSPEQNGRVEFCLPYSKTIIAQRLGVSPETLSRAFVGLREHGVTMQRETVVIDDMLALQQLAH